MSKLAVTALPPLGYGRAMASSNPSNRGGEYTAPFLAAERARYQFLQAVRRRCPLPLIHLRSRIFPLYSQWVDAFMSEAKAIHEWNQSPEAAAMREGSLESFQALGLSPSAAKFAAEGRPVVGVDADHPVFSTFMILEDQNPRLARSLMLWAQRHGLTHQREFEDRSHWAEGNPPAPESAFAISEFTEATLHKDYWACAWAMFTMWHWKFAPDGPVEMKANPPHWVPAFEENLTPDLTEPGLLIKPGWNVSSENEDAFRTRTQKAIDSYIEKQHQFARGRGLVAVVPKKEFIHFDWLALSQVKGYSLGQVVAWDQEQPGEKFRDPGTIRKGVDEAARLCEMKAKPRTVGRPKTRN
jgi:hypothetical protein